MSEHDTQAAFIEYVRIRENQVPELKWLHAIPNGGARNVVVAVKLKAEGVRRGVPDIFWPCPRGGYHGLYIEFKDRKNKLTKEQREFLDYAWKRGYMMYVAYSVDKAIEVLEDYIKSGVAVDTVRIVLGGE